jgi:hypothetical protein
MSRDSLIESAMIPLGLLRRYLAARGWRRGAEGRESPDGVMSPGVIAAFQARCIGRPNTDLFVLSEDGADDVELIVPRERSGSDYDRRIFDTLRILSMVEGRTMMDVLNDVRMVGYDVVRSRIPDMLVQDDSIHLEIAANYTAGIKSLLSSIANTQIDPQPYFLRVRREAKEFAEKCRFGHTFRGSFGFTIESPIIPNNEPALPEMAQTAPFERLVIQRFARGMQSLCNAVKMDDLASLVSETKTGFSANAYEQLANLIEETSPSGMNFAFSFSPEWVTSPELLKATEFAILQPHVEASRSAAKLLRTEFAPRSEKVFGRVVRLESEGDPSDLLNPSGEREIAIQWSSADLGDIQVRVRLLPKDYLLALRAHAVGRPVSVSGTLEKRGRTWVLTGPSDFEAP